MPNIISKMKAEVDEYILLTKNRKRVSASQRSREENFSTHIAELFDIAHKEAEVQIRIEEDKVFLLDQRQGRKMTMGGVDKKLADKEERSRKRRLQEKSRKAKETERKSMASTPSTSCTGNISDECSENDEKSDDETDNDYEVEIPIHYRRQQLITPLTLPEEDSSSSKDSKKPHIVENILQSPDVASAVDRIKLSDTEFTILALTRKIYYQMLTALLFVSQVSMSIKYWALSKQNLEQVKLKQKQPRSYFICGKFLKIFLPCVLTLQPQIQVNTMVHVLYWRNS